MNSNIAVVTDASQATGRSANEVLSAARHLSESGHTLKHEVEDFLHNIRAA